MPVLKFITVGREGLELHILHSPHMDVTDLDPNPY